MDPPIDPSSDIRLTQIITPDPNTTLIRKPNWSKESGRFGSKNRVRVQSAHPYSLVVARGKKDSALYFMHANLSKDMVNDVEKDSTIHMSEKRMIILAKKICYLEEILCIWRNVLIVLQESKIGLLSRVLLLQE